MKHDQGLLEGYAMKALEMTEPLPTAGWLNIEEVGATLSLPRDQSKQLALDMQQEGWAVVRFSPTESVADKLQLTHAGKKAIAEFRLTGWRQWLNKNPGVTAAVVSGAISLVFNALAELFKWWLAKPTP
jgi:hypothetical protein